MAQRLLCSFHKTGVPYPFVKAGDFFQRGCRVCAEKLAKGIVNGTEPPPPAHDNPAQAALSERVMRKEAANWVCVDCGHSHERDAVAQCPACGSEEPPVNVSARESWR